MNRKKKSVTGLVLALIAICAVGTYITYHLLDYKDKIFLGDYVGLSTWTSFFFKSIVNFGVFPTWSHLWQGGMPFFGLVPPGFYFITGFIRLFTSSSSGAVYLTAFIFFVLGGVTMFFYILNLTKSRLAALFAGIFYLIIPVHTGSMLTNGMADLTICLALIPLILLGIDKTFEDARPWRIFSLAFLICVFFLVQIEMAVLVLIFILVPVLAYKLIAYRKRIGRVIGSFIKNPWAVLATIFVVLLSASFYCASLTQSDNFAYHSETTVADGRDSYSFKKISDIVTQKAQSASDIYTNTKAEYYLGWLPIILFFIFAITSIFGLEKAENGTIMITFFYWRKKGRQRMARDVFLVLSALFFFLACFNNWPIFNSIVKYIPVLSKMRVPFRFYYFFIIIFIVAVSYLIKDLYDFLGTKIGRGRYKKLVGTGLFLLVMVPLFISYKPYFRLYLAKFFPSEDISCEQIYAAAKSSSEKIIRLYDFPESLELCAKDGAQSFETTHSWLSWTETQKADQFVDNMEVGNEEYAFYTSLFSINYSAFQYANALPATINGWLEAYKHNFKTLEDNSQFKLVEQDEDSAHLFSLFKNLDAIPKVYFYPSASTLFLNETTFTKSGETAYHSYYDLYKDYKDSILKNKPTNLIKAVAVVNDIDAVGDLERVSQPSEDELKKAVENISHSNQPTITNFELTPRGIKLNATASEDGVLMINYMNAPWWKLTINGQKAEVINVNGLMIGVRLNSGQNKIVLNFDYPYIRYAKYAVLVGILSSGFYLIIFSLFSLRKKTS